MDEQAAYRCGQPEDGKRTASAEQASSRQAWPGSGVVTKTFPSGKVTPCANAHHFTLAIPGGGRWSLSATTLAWLFHVPQEQVKSRSGMKAV